MIEPLSMSFEVACQRDHAFHVWTSGFGTWWPRAHTVSGDPRAEIVLEPLLGGRIFERAADGGEIAWGEVTGWDPPHRLSYLWHIGRDPSDATDVQIAFVPLDDGTTRIDIVHTGWERLGPEGRSWRDANGAGWADLVPHYLTACTPDPAAAPAHPDTQETTA